MRTRPPGGAPLGPGVHALPVTPGRRPTVPSSPRARHAAGRSPGLAEMGEEARVGLSANIGTEGMARRRGRKCVSPVQPRPAGRLCKSTCKSTAPEGHTT